MRAATVFATVQCSCDLTGQKQDFTKQKLIVTAISNNNQNFLCFWIPGVHIYIYIYIPAKSKVCKISAVPKFIAFSGKRRQLLSPSGF